MRTFNDNDFLLMNDYGKRLYHEIAASLPVIDPHNHIDAGALATNKKFENVYQLWVQHDPYKHRAMRIYGIPEDLITGSRSDYEKFLAWATCFPATIGNPLFHWSCMELQTLFGIKELLTPQSAQQVWDTANNLLQQDKFSAMGIVKGFGVEMLCTSDDLNDSLEHHLHLAKQRSVVTCLPSLRADNILAFDYSSFQEWLKQLQAQSEINVVDLQTYTEAIVNRLNFFDKAGCLLSDHSLDSGFTYVTCNSMLAAPLFERVLSGEPLTTDEVVHLRSFLLYFLGVEYAKRKWKMQLHIGAYRYTSSVLRNKVGPAGGYACIGNTVNVQSLTRFLDDLDRKDDLPKTILYTLNPADNDVFASLTGSYCEDGVQAKIQFGPAWWYNDHHDGILKQLNALSSFGLLSTAIGMTTDSRSLVSFIRHQYYRRILCNLLGSWVKEGNLPNDWELLSTMVKNISYNNIKSWIKND